MISRLLIIISFLSISALISCQESNEFIGTWYYYGNDDDYCELYVNDTLISYISDNESFGDFYYKKKGLNFYFNNSGRKVKISLVKIKTDTIIATANNYPVTYYRLSKNANSYFNNLSLNNNTDINNFRRRRDSILAIRNSKPEK